MKKKELRNMIREEIMLQEKSLMSDKEALEILLNVLKKRWGDKNASEMEQYFEDKSKAFLKKIKAELKKSGKI
jgi:hypothetical protein